MKLLITGGAGFIGSHTSIVMLQAGYRITIVDNFSNSSPAALARIAKISGNLPLFVEGDVRDSLFLNNLFSKNSFDAVIHFAGLKAVGESVAQPLHYYDNNVNGCLALLRAMGEANILKFVFSSSATVYGEPTKIPISESSSLLKPTNPYGRSKLIVEDILRDLALSNPRWRFAILRYFNPVGAHPSGLLGEDPSGIPNNLLPYISQVAVGKLSELNIFGNDYPTIDGTGVRDYIHIMDLAEGHLSALKALNALSGFNVWNLGTGSGFSVMQMLRAFESASGKSIPYRISQRRPGDIASCYANTEKAELELGWKAKRDLNEIVADAWRWQFNHPNGLR